MVKINIPQLRQPELPNVTAFVTDTFYKPQKEPINPSLKNLANSLSNLVPSLRRYDIEKEEVFKIDEEDRAIKDMEENKNAFKDLTKNGVIPEGASPYYINALAKQQLKLDGREFKERLFAEWDNNNVWTDSDPAAFEKFYRTFSNTYRDEKKLDSYAPSTLVEGFLPDADAAYNELSQRHREKRIAEIEKTNIDLLNKNVSAIIDDFQSIDFFDEDEETQYLSNMVQQQLNFIVDNGMNPRTANETIVDAIVAQAISYRDPEYLEILNKIKTNGNSKLSGTAYADKALKEVPLEIERLNQLQANNEYNNYVRAKTLNDRFSQNQFFDYLEGSEDNVINITTFIKQENERRVENGIPELDADVITTFNTLTNNYIDAKNPTFIENKLTISDLREQIYLNPSNPKLYKLLHDALGEEITIDTFKVLNEELSKAQDFKDHPFRKDPLYLSIIGQVTKFSPDFRDTDDNYFAGLANVAINTLTDDVLEELSDEKFRMDNGLTTTRKQKQYLNDIIKEEVSRIIKEFANANLDVPSALSGDVNQAQAGQRIINKDFNPYE